jgi:hypothetical protein
VRGGLNPASAEWKSGASEPHAAATAEPASQKQESRTKKRIGRASTPAPIERPSERRARRRGRWRFLLPRVSLSLPSCASRAALERESRSQSSVEARADGELRKDREDDGAGSTCGAALKPFRGHRAFADHRIRGTYAGAAIRRRIREWHVWSGDESLGSICARMGRRSALGVRVPAAGLSARHGDSSALFYADALPGFDASSDASASPGSNPGARASSDPAADPVRGQRRGHAANP